MRIDTLLFRKHKTIYRTKLFFRKIIFLQKRARKAFKQDKESIMEIASTFGGQMRDKHLLQQKSVNPQGETSVNFETYVRDKDHIWRFG